MVGKVVSLDDQARWVGPDEFLPLEKMAGLRNTRFRNVTVHFSEMG